MNEKNWNLGAGLPVKLLLLLVIWVVLSISGVMIGPLRCDPAVELWEYVTGGQFAEEQFAKRVEGTRFPANSYQTYINPGTNANLAASDSDAAAFYRSTLYITHNGRLYSLDTKKPTEFKTLGNVTELDALIAGKGCLLAADEASIRFIKTPKFLSHTLEEENWLASYQGADFGSVADRLYALLQKQEDSKLTGPEISALAHLTKEGTLLAYENQTAWLADSRTEPGTVIVYQQTAPGQRTEAFRYQNNYTGLGAGRFAVENFIVYADGGPLNIYAMDDSFWLRFEVEGINTPSKALNYAYDADGILWITYIDDELVLHCYRYDPSDDSTAHKTVTIPSIPEGGTVDGLFTVGNTAYVFFTASDGSLGGSSYTLE